MMPITGYEIDFLAVGEKSKSGDAILFRYKEDNKYVVILIDGGHKESEGVKTSDLILKHMRKYYFPCGTSDADMTIDHIICSHPDSDHVGGLPEIMETCKVGTLWINNPRDYVAYNNLSNDSDTNCFSKNDADTVSYLIKVAEQKDVAVNACLQGTRIGPFVVASPDASFYRDLVSGDLNRQGKEKSSFKSVLVRVASWIAAVWNKDELKEFPATSVCNESSVVLYGSLINNKEKILMTADAGIEALSRAYDYINDYCDFESGSLTFIQMPHHGSRHNVNVEVLDKLLGVKIAENSDPRRGILIASVAKEATNYPKKSVLNAFITRGYKCCSTHGKTMWYHEGDMPDRKDFSTADALNYSSQVEAIDD
jgi:hypothetical protein